MWIALYLGLSYWFNDKITIVFKIGYWYIRVFFMMLFNKVTQLICYGFSLNNFIRTHSTDWFVWTCLKADYLKYEIFLCEWIICRELIAQSFLKVKWNVSSFRVRQISNNRRIRISKTFSRAEFKPKCLVNQVRILFCIFQTNLFQEKRNDKSLSSWGRMCMCNIDF